MSPTSRPGLLATMLVALVLALAGCSEEARQDIVDRVEGALDQPGTEATEEPTAAPTATEEPTADPTETPTATESATDDPTEEPAPTEEPTQAPSPTEDPLAGEDGEVEDVPAWFWVLVFGLLLLLLLIVAAIIRRFRRRRALAARRAGLRDTVLAETDWLLGTAAERATSLDGAGRARDIRMRADRLSAALQELRTGRRGKAVVALTDLQASTHQLADALVTRLDDAVAGRPATGAAGIPALVARVTQDRAAFARAFGARH